jgi:putative transcriptional regulator
VSPAHHPSEDVLADYASGALADGPSLVVSAHLEHCACCRKAKALFEAIGGEALEETAPADMPSDALDLALARLDRPAPAIESESEAAAPGDVALPAALRGRRFGRRRYVGPGTWVAHVRSSSPDGWRTYLLRAPSGAAVPQHGHNGPEYTVVLRGAYRDGDVRYDAGDFAACDEDDRHDLKAEGPDPCLCLISSRGGIRGRGLARLLHAWLGV